MNRRQGSSELIAAGVEPLEGRSLLSSLTPAHGGGKVSAEVLPSGPTLALPGSAHGLLHRVQGSPDVGASAGFAATGHLGGMGQVRVTGTVWGTGAIVGGEFSGEIFVSDHSGSMTLRLLGPQAASFTAPASGSYAYTVVAGTGAYAQSTGHGTIAMTLGPRAVGLAFGGPHA